MRLIRAFEGVRNLSSSTLQLVIAGGHGWLKRPIFEAIKNSKASQDIILLCVVPQELLAALYWQAEVFVLPSLYEGFGLPVLEAAACGTPVVASNVSSLPEILRGVAELVNPEYVPGIVAGIERILADRTWRQKLIERGRQRASTFSWDRSVRETLAVYEQAALQ